MTRAKFIAHEPDFGTAVKNKKVIPWRAFLLHLVSKYGRAQLAIKLAVEERILELITRGIVIPGVHMQENLLSLYVVDTGKTVKEALDA